MHSRSLGSTLLVAKKSVERFRGVEIEKVAYDGSAGIDLCRDHESDATRAARGIDDGKGAIRATDETVIAADIEQAASDRAAIVDAENIRTDAVGRIEFR